RQAVNRRRVEDHGPEVRDNRANGVDVGLLKDVVVRKLELLNGKGDLLQIGRQRVANAVRGNFKLLCQVETGRRLHPGVGYHNPDRTEVRTETDHERGKKMRVRTDFVPAEEQDGEEAGFQKEGVEPLNRERATEDV